MMGYTHYYNIMTKQKDWTILDNILFDNTI